MMINQKEISVIVQGAIIPDLTIKTLTSLKKFLPGSRIIVSTWDGADVSSINCLCDEIVFSPDPGDVGEMHIEELKISKKNNINRQIVSTREGLKKSRTRYSLKIRTDFIVENLNFLRYFGKFGKWDSQSDLRLFDERIICAGADRPWLKPFFPYDFLFFGLTQDLLKLFDIKLMSKEEATWFPDHRPINLDNYNYIKGRFRYIPEQHIFLTALSKQKTDIFNYVKDCSDVNCTNVLLSQKALIENFVVLTFNDFGIYPLKESLNWLLFPTFHTLTFKEWNVLYDNEYGNAEDIIPASEKPPLYRMKKHIIKAKNSKNILVTIREFLCSCFYVFKYIRMKNF